MNKKEDISIIELIKEEFFICLNENVSTGEFLDRVFCLIYEFIE